MAAPADPGPGYGLPTGQHRQLGARPPERPADGAAARRAPDRPALPPAVRPAAARAAVAADHRPHQPPPKRRGARSGRGARPAGRGAEHLQQIIDSFNAQMRALWQPGSFERGGNTKTHGVVRAELIVRDDLPENLRRGIFAEPRTLSGLGAVLRPGPVRDRRHRRRRLHEHEHQADGGGRGQAAGRRAAHPGHARRLARPPSSPPTPAPTRSCSAGACRNAADLLLLQPARAARARLDHAVPVDEDAVEPARGASTSAACPTCSARARR